MLTSPLREIIVEALRSTQRARELYSPLTSTLADLERAFVPLAEAGAWNRAHPESPITTLDLGTPLSTR